MTIHVNVILFEDLHDTLEITDSAAGVLLRTYSPNMDKTPNQTVYERVQQLLARHKESLLNPGLTLKLVRSGRIYAHLQDDGCPHGCFIDVNGEHHMPDREAQT